MHWVLIAVFATSSNAGGLTSFSFQEFDSKETCEAAKIKAVAMSKYLRNDIEYQLECVKK